MITFNQKKKQQQQQFKKQNYITLTQNRVLKNIKNNQPKVEVQEK